MYVNLTPFELCLFQNIKTECKENQEQQPKPLQIQKGERICFFPASQWVMKTAVSLKTESQERDETEGDGEKDEKGALRKDVSGKKR